jgi:hypothetical protein
MLVEVPRSANQLNQMEMICNDERSVRRYGASR